ncbi:DUF4091 domain-containing protein [Marinicrinis lubricantis]|uniref:DUF4091 domain-containing protein n=1 Tax=Marinicrinis lubricantis TaxID=2086470 RepID=A0ABW1ILF3_9BACL
MGENPMILQLISSLSKVFPDEHPRERSMTRLTALMEENISFQAALYSTERMTLLRFRVESPLAPYISVYEVGLVPSELPVYSDHDDFVLRSEPGLYPDPLYVLEPDRLCKLPGGQWRAFWIEVDRDSKAAPGTYPIRVMAESAQGELLAEAVLELELLPAALPLQRLIHTEWFHCDCIAAAHHTAMFSEKHWHLMERYVRTAVKHGMNMILTPLFTPPLDTAVGGERPTAQLVEVRKIGRRYEFGFAALLRWVQMCRAAGIQFFEFSHLFTQWGAKHAPKIVGLEDGELKLLFGWHTDAAGEEYRQFLDQFLPELVRFIKQYGIEKYSYFHVSDEPHLEHLEAYKTAASILDRHLAQFPRIDALSDYAFYEQGLVPCPIPANNHLEPFLEQGVQGLWTYYCCSQYLQVSNRFFCFPSVRNRIIGIQLYKYRIEGFLHWGYNFWNAQYSVHPIDPYRITDSGLAFPSGDAFLVYPGDNGPVESLRLKVFHEALQDLRALELLESYVGRERVMQLLEDGLDEPITWKHYPRESEWLLSKREEVNAMIRRHAYGTGVNS